MRTTTDHDVSGGNADQHFTILWREGILFYMNMNAGWNLISLPLTPDNSALPALFPDAEVAYGYEDGGYVDAASLEPGKGYWVKVPADQTYTMEGQPFPGYTASLSSGWHLLGSVNTTSSPQVVPEGAMQVMYQYFDGSYRKVTQFSPGYGYWVGAEEACEFAVESE